MIDFHPSFQTQSAWSKQPETTTKVLTIARDLCLASLDAFSGHTNSNRSMALSQLSSARLSAQGCVKATKDEKWDHCEELLQSLGQSVENIKNVLTSNL